MIETRGTWTKIVRGPLPGAGKWTHEYADAANTTCSDDRFVKCPLGLLWYGDPGPFKTTSRHKRATSPLSVNGIFFVASENIVRAYDAYNGLKLWDVNIPNVVRTDVSGESGNLAADENSFYVATGNKCLRLDAETGVIKATYTVPSAVFGKSRRWGHVAVNNNILLGSGAIATNRNSDVLFACDTTSGATRWIRWGENIQHTSISVDGNRVFFADTGVPQAITNQTAVTNIPTLTIKWSSPVRNVTALDLATGKTLWRKQMDLTGCVGNMLWGALGSMVHNDVLIFFGVYTDGHYWRDFFANQFAQRRIIAVSAQNGEQLWASNIAYRVRPIIIGNTLHAEPWSFDLQTGEQRTRVNPVTGLTEPWQFARPGHHCGCPAASPNVMAFRSYHIGYYDLLGDSGTCTFGSVRPGCWINFILANGLLMVPEASSGCQCPFPNMCTVVLAPCEENRAWGKYSLAGDIYPVNHLAINLNGPGDRKDDAGTLWLGYPRRKESLVLQFKIDLTLLPGGEYFAKSPDTFQIKNTTSPRLYTFGIRGLQRCRIPLLQPGDAAARYTVRLGFTEIDDVKAGDRIFDIKLQGETKLKQFDIIQQSGGCRKVIVKEFKEIEVKNSLDIEFVPGKKLLTPQNVPILQTVEIVREK
jgi:outer membrane protein assembly factor BamB